MKHEYISAEDFRTWASGKLSDEDVNTLIALLSDQELLDYKREWEANNG